MQRSDFKFDLPPELIAQAPSDVRTGARLLVLDGASGDIDDRQFGDIAQSLRSGDLLVLNDTRVLPARLEGRKSTGGRVEIMLERITARREALVQIKASRSPNPGAQLALAGGRWATVIERQGALFCIEFDTDAQAFFERFGAIPLPPYIERAATQADSDRYQTVYAQRPGAVAAPTAGLHFDEALLAQLNESGVRQAHVTLHVGMGTFAPMRVQDIEQHEIHSERVRVTPAVCEQIAQTRAAGGRVIAVGTTVVRALETAASSGELKPYDGESRLFIYPGYSFRVIDAMLTNFHLSESSLLMLVAAFAGREHVLAAYQHAVEERYRFFSYGDAMFITPQQVRKADHAV